MYLYLIALTQPSHGTCDAMKKKEALMRSLFHFSATLNLYSKHIFHCLYSQKYACYVTACSLTILLNALLLMTA